MRAPSAVFMLLALGASACGALTGLGDYSTGPAPDDASARPRDASAGRDAPSAVEASDETSGGDTGDGDGEWGGSDAAGDAIGGGDDAEPLADADGPSDAALDGLPPCTSSNCGGCCSGGICYGGKSTGTCGTGGEECEACSGSTPACSSAGSCVAATVDAAAPPKCTPSSCSGCNPAYQTSCCRSDGTCGCSIFWVPGSSCM